MNLLLYVISILLVLTAMSYQTLSDYKRSDYLRLAADYNFKVNWVCDYNDSIEQLFKAYKKSRKNKISAAEMEDVLDGIEEEAKDSSSKINMYRLIRKETEPNKMGQQWDKLIEQLIGVVFSGDVFYQQWIQKRPHIVIDTLEALKVANGQLTAPIKQVQNLAKIELEDPDLNTFWHALQTESYLTNSEIASLYTGKGVTKGSLAETCTKIKFVRDFFTNKDKNKLRVYLTSPLILLALTGDIQSANAIVLYRNTLFKEYKSTNSRSQKELSSDFEAFCKQFPVVEEFADILSFVVTKTNPKNYK